MRTIGLGLRAADRLRLPLILGPASTDKIAEPHQGPPMSGDAAADSALLRIGAVAGIAGVLLQVVMDQMHPAHADPNDSKAAFTESRNAASQAPSQCSVQ